MRIFGREPALWLGALASALGLAVTLGFGELTRAQAAVIVTAVAAVAAAVTAALTRPIAPSAFTGLVAVAFDLLAAFHFRVSPETVGAVNAVVLSGLALLTRGQVSPKTAPAAEGWERL
jgi:drug/metabolite transporter (DMT)-like permease